MRSLYVNEKGQIAWKNSFNERVVTNLTALFSVDKHGATLQKIADKDYVDNILGLHHAAFPDTKEHYYVKFEMSKLTEDKHEQLKIADYFINHTLSDKVKDLVVAVHNGNLDVAVKISKKML